MLFIPGCARAPRRILPPSMPSAALPAPGGFYHEVQRGETLYRIAKTYGMDWHELMAANRIGHPGQLETGQRLFIPQGAPQLAPPLMPGPLTLDDLRRIIGPRRSQYSWSTITVHHSGTLQGGAQAFNRNHIQRHMGGLFYHFVIGNGSSTPDGALEVGWRWQQQVKANRPNDIQVCLVGDFNRQFVSDAQFNTLVKLIQVLREEYGVPIENIRRHEDIPGKNTECPGQHFPFSRLISELRLKH